MEVTPKYSGFLLPEERVIEFKLVVVNLDFEFKHLSGNERGSEEW